MGILSAAIGCIRPSATKRASELRGAGRDVLALSAGEPNVERPENLKAATMVAIDRGEIKHTPDPGIVPLRQAVAEKSGRENGPAHWPQGTIACTGGRLVISSAVLATLDLGDEVVFGAPCCGRIS